MEEVITLLSKLTKHKHVIVVESGNMALMMAFSIAKQLGKTKLLMPDQGGWYSYKRYPAFLGMDFEEVKTHYGVFHLTDLQKVIGKSTALVVPSFAGYFAEQPLTQIASACKSRGTLLIEDASSAVGDRMLCNGSKSDIIVASFGEHKPVNFGYGGFVSVREAGWFDLIPELISASRFYEPALPGLSQKLKELPQRLDFLFSVNSKIKKELHEEDILHRDKRGINVVVNGISQHVVDYCERNSYPFLRCPNSIRVKQKAISIEVKRLI